jgi:hypothetical protein
MGEFEVFLLAVLGVLTLGVIGYRLISRRSS